jgi:trk system potassium uptake protein TrkH
MILSALPFAFHYYIFSKKGLISKKSLGPEVTVYLILMAVAIPIFFALGWSGGASDLDFGASAFHIVSAATSSGFQYVDVQSMPSAPKIFLIVLMLVGGTAFSTAGGIKVGRFVILYYEFAKRIGKGDSKQPSTAMLRSISSTSNPHRSQTDKGGLLDRIQEVEMHDIVEILRKRGEIVRVVKEVLGVKLVKEILIVIGLYIFLSVLTGSILSANTGRSFEDGMFESVSAISTTGMTTGITSINLDAFSKLMLVSNMILGRFEIIAILYIFVSSLRK